MSSTNEVISSKRRKTTATTTTKIRINDLPHGILTNVAIYLAVPSVVMFAMAVTQDGASTQMSNTIISAASSTPNNNNEQQQQQQQLQILDFGDIDKSLAAKLTDDHITKILTHIDASNNLKTLKLVGCVNITGSCLDIIRSSVILERLDLSLLGKQERPLLDPEPLLSESIVIPILDSIIGGRTLKLLHLPKKFRVNISQEMNQFLERYNEYLSSFQYNCSKCTTACLSTGSGMWIFCNRPSIDRSFIGTQNYTCSVCARHFCFDDDCRDHNDNEYIQSCAGCETHYCKECVPTNECGGCGEDYCDQCDTLEKVCGDCDMTLCNECILRYKCTFCDREETKCMDCTRNHKCLRWRSGCKKVICAECVESKGDGGKCDKCLKAFCSSECQYLYCNEDWGKACFTCTQSTATYFRSKCQDYKKENEEICQEMDKLRST